MVQELFPWIQSIVASGFGYLSKTSTSLMASRIKYATKIKIFILWMYMQNNEKFVEQFDKIEF